MQPEREVAEVADTREGQQEAVLPVNPENQVNQMSPANSSMPTAGEGEYQSDPNAVHAVHPVHASPAPRTNPAAIALVQGLHISQLGLIQPSASLGTLLLFSHWNYFHYFSPFLFRPILLFIFTITLILYAFAKTFELSAESEGRKL